jgi:hypothetical protein
MAKEQREGKGKVRVFFAEVEGTDATIQNGLQSLAMALARAMQPPPPVRVVKPLSNGSGARDGLTYEQPTLFDQVSDQTEVDLALQRGF